MQNYYKDQGKSINSLTNLKVMKLASLNINSITKHIDELRILMKDKPLDLIANNESKIDDTILDRKIHIIGYNMI
jgi:exonuclease III